MNVESNEAFFLVKPENMSDRLYEKFSKFFYAECGIKLPPAKKVMLQSRLLKRLRACRLNSFEDYYDYLTSGQGQEKELIQAIDVVSTNKTDFFRESDHFQYLTFSVLPEILRILRSKHRKKIHLWSAGCSSGEEPYTLVIVMSEFLTNYPEFDFDILATDISLRMLTYAQTAIYSQQSIQSVPPHLRNKYLMKGKGSWEGNWRIMPELRSKVNFQRLNFMDEVFALPQAMDIIFCRNVVIYFDLPTQKRLFQKFYNHLIPGGFLFIGHSETLHGINSQFEHLQATVYRKPL